MSITPTCLHCKMLLSNACYSCFFSRFFIFFPDFNIFQWPVDCKVDSIHFLRETSSLIRKSRRSGGDARNGGCWGREAGGQLSSKRRDFGQRRWCPIPLILGSVSINHFLPLFWMQFGISALQWNLSKDINKNKYWNASRASTRTLLALWTILGDLWCM
jgi:hypothetical protein